MTDARVASVIVEVATSTVLTPALATVATSAGVTASVIRNGRNSNYPDGFDSFPVHSDGVGEVIHASTLNNLQDAIAAIQAALGLNPQGTHGTVADRLKNLDGGL